MAGSGLPIDLNSGVQLCAQTDRGIQTAGHGAPSCLMMRASWVFHTMVEVIRVLGEVLAAFGGQLDKLGAWSSWWVPLFAGSCALSVVWTLLL